MKSPVCRGLPLILLIIASAVAYYGWPGRGRYRGPPDPYGPHGGPWERRDRYRNRYSNRDRYGYRNRGGNRRYPKCSGGQLYTTCGSQCPRTCAEPNPVCGAVCVEGCQCPRHLVVYNGRCYQERSCPADALTAANTTNNVVAVVSSNTGATGQGGQNTGTVLQNTGTGGQNTGAGGQNTGTGGQNTGTGGQNTGTGRQNAGTGGRNTGQNVVGGTGGTRAKWMCYKWSPNRPTRECTRIQQRDCPNNCAGHHPPQMCCEDHTGCDLECMDAVPNTV
uniref:Shell matrix protein n=1 Tax=Laqueus rubellus TaxID=93892 RepID=A0A3G9CLZ5_LAQRU